MKKQLADATKRSSKGEYFCRKLVSCIPYRWRQRKAFWDFYELLDRTQYMDPDKLRVMQFEQLKETLKFAYEHSGFYRRLYDAHGLNIDAIQSFNDFRQKIPVVDKAMLKNRTDLSVPFKGAEICITSGTTGSPFQFPVEPDGLAREKAAIFHQWQRIGFGPQDTRIEMRGFQTRPIVDLPNLNVVRFSVVDMDRHIRQMVSYMNRKKIPFIHGYPSAVAKFAALLRDNSLALNYPVKGVMLASENVFDWQVQAIREVITPSKVIAHYGCAEMVALGAWCEAGNSYHFLPLYGYLEKGDENQIIATGFVHRATPFIRYQMTDTVLDWSDTLCPHCQRGYTPIIRRIGGRLEDYLVDQKGELIPPAVATFPFKKLRIILNAQIIQREDRKLVFRYVASNRGSVELEKEKQAVERDFKIMLGNSTLIEFEQVDQIPLTGACKYKWIISEIGRERTARTVKTS